MVARARPRVYVEIRHRDASIRRLLDLVYDLDHRPIAVMTWTKAGNVIEPGEYVELDERRLHRAAPAGTFRYEGIVEDPRFPPRGRVGPPAVEARD